MKKSLALLTATLLCTPAFADEVNFYGSISQSTCVIDTSNSKLSVRLATTPNNSLREPGSFASPTNFHIALKDCPNNNIVLENRQMVAKSRVSIAFDGTHKNVTPEGTLQNTTTGITGANNVEVAIFEASANSPLNLKTDKVVQDVELATNNGQPIRLNFVAKFTSKDGSATAGDFSSSVPFKIEYR